MEIDDLITQLTTEGVAGPIPVLTLDECAEIAAHERSGLAQVGLDWRKGRAATDPFYAGLAADKRFIDLVQPILGDDIVLWGVDILHRGPDQVHPWHCDIESCAPEGGFMSVWIGIENASRHSALNCVIRSHRFGATLQAVANARGLRRGEATGDHVLQWAKEFDPGAAIVAPDIRDGDAIVFDGRLWHGTHNTHAEGIRTALLLQYASASRPVRMIDFEKLEWPLYFLEEPRPPVLVVSGRGDPAINRVVQPPACQ